MPPLSIAAKFYALIQAVQTNTLTEEQQTFLTALLEDELQVELQAQAIFEAPTPVGGTNGVTT